MKPNSDIDPDFATKRWYWKPLTRARWLLIFGLTASTLAQIPTSPTPSRQVFAQVVAPVLLAGDVLLPRPAPGPSIPLAQQPIDHFIVMASPSIDPEMVHQAPAGIDEAMVVPSPERRRVFPMVVAPEGGEPQYLPVPPGSENQDDPFTPKTSPDRTVPAKPK